MLTAQAGSADTTERQNQIKAKLLALQADLAAATAKLNATLPQYQDYIANYNQLAVVSTSNFYTCYKSLFGASSYDFTYDSDGLVQFNGLDAFYKYIKSVYDITLVGTPQTTTSGSSDTKTNT